MSNFTVTAVDAGGPVAPTIDKVTISGAGERLTESSPREMGDSPSLDEFLQTIEAHKRGEVPEDFDQGEEQAVELDLDVGKGRRFAQVAREQKAAREARAAADQLQREVAPVKSALDKYNANPSDKNALAMLQELGIDYWDLTAAIASDEDLSVGDTEKTVYEIAEEIATQKVQELEEKQTQAYIDTTLNKHMSKLASVAQQSPQEFEFVNAYGMEAIQEALSLTEHYFYETGESLLPEQALQLIEQHLEEEHAKSLQFTKIQRRASGSEKVSRDRQVDGPRDKRAPKVTLTNKDAGANSSRNRNDSQSTAHLDKDDAIAAIAARFSK